MRLSVVTSCSKQGWDKYGRRFLDTFHKHWPLAVTLHFVSEDVLELPVSITGPRKVHFLDLGASKSYASFEKRHRENMVAHGRGAEQVHDPRYRKVRGFYSYRHDAYRFSKKVFSINLALTEVKADRLIWLDADTVTVVPIPLDLFTKVHPAGPAIAYLDRTPHHSECGFVSYDLGHPSTIPFIQEFERLYASDEVFQLQEWHDSWVFDWLRNKLKVPSHQIPYNRAWLSHPFVHSELGKYMDHLKGARKDRGVSHDHPKYTGKGHRRSAHISRARPRARPI